MKQLLLTIEQRTNGQIPPAATILMTLLLVGLILALTPLFPHLIANNLVWSGEIHRLLTCHWVSTGVFPGLFALVLVGFLYRQVRDVIGDRLLLISMVSVQLVCALLTLSILGGAYGFRAALYVLLVAFATIAPQARMIFIFIPMPAWLLVTIVIAIDILMGVSQTGWAWHLFPLLGAALGFALIRFRGQWAAYQRKRAQFQQELSLQQRNNDDQELDRILAKVSEVGIGELSKKEKKFLDTYRKRHTEE